MAATEQQYEQALQKFAAANSGKVEFFYVENVPRK